MLVSPGAAGFPGGLERAGEPHVHAVDGGSWPLQVVLLDVLLMGVEEATLNNDSNRGV